METEDDIDLAEDCWVGDGFGGFAAFDDLVAPEAIVGVAQRDANATQWGKRLPNGKETGREEQKLQSKEEVRTPSAD